MSRESFERWRDEQPNQRYGTPVCEAWQAAQTEMQEQLNKNRYLINALESSIEQYDTRVNELEAQLREQHQNQLDLMEQITALKFEVLGKNAEIRKLSGDEPCPI